MKIYLATTMFRNSGFYITDLFERESKPTWSEIYALPVRQVCPSKHCKSRCHYCRNSQSWSTIPSLQSSWPCPQIPYSKMHSSGCSPHLQQQTSPLFSRTWAQPLEIFIHAPFSPTKAAAVVRRLTAPNAEIQIRVMGWFSQLLQRMLHICVGY